MPRFEPFAGVRYDLDRLALDGLALDVLSGPALRARAVFDRGTATVKGWTALP